MRKSAKDLSHVWRWGTDTQADLLIVDASNFAGQMARSRAKVTGMRVALVCDAEESTDGDPAFVRPFKTAEVLRILNLATDTAETLSSPARGEDDYYQSQTRSFGSDADLGELLMGDDESTHWPVDSNVAPGLDELFRDNPLADLKMQLDKKTFDKNADVEGSGEQTQRGAMRSDRERETQGVPLNAAAAARTPTRKQNIEDLSLHGLRAFLEGDLIASPVQIAWTNAGVLTLDPKNQVFHCAKSLPKLEVYSRESMRRSDWRVLSTAELHTIRESQDAQPYAKLIWLDVLLHANGQLASNLDPGGTFELSRWHNLVRDYPNIARITAALMQPARLHQVAAASGCEMSLVFDVVSAYDAIGWLKWTPRRSRHEDPSDSKKSFLSRLRNPFAKS